VALFLLRSEKLSAKLIKYGTPFAAGVLLIIAFRDLLPEAIVEDGADVLNSALGAILIFFLIEKGFKSFHHHHEEDIVEQKDTTQGWLFVIGDVFHNLIDGISLGGAFLIGRETGLIATVALISHDIPRSSINLPNWWRFKSSNGLFIRWYSWFLHLYSIE